MAPETTSSKPVTVVGLREGRQDPGWHHDADESYEVTDSLVDAQGGGVLIALRRRR
ncbi:hypothetical protein [Brachybacterium sp. FME24]|uniref:hypothetical protein n=1 Tax=Brachybacterium sp. FME24 TaxID=2742605 RepID=UPI001868F9C3|nr:hypothetical protein [Brachybacterium sp. FME24]